MEPTGLVAFTLIPRPDFAATTTVSAANAADHTAERWAREIFSVPALPAWVKALFAGREVAAKLLRLPPGDPAMLAVDRVVDGEAVIDTDDRHLRFVATVRITPGLVHVTTAVRLKGWRGKLYFAPVRLLHDTVTRAMMISALHRLGGLRTSPAAARP
ncbi:DUF2867 domain-containing protein [Actinoallomurus sp. NBC_01490]|uniref:DUF2867 domain-containing protein n=1 Tax=Actinoallomurus sp. NBC_01490 TaxID=2903557 RepID=UPI002E3597E2|nr:DUF2867 domain-containing protein [Actinoallomurus sp. NBC_01490]